MPQFANEHPQAEMLEVMKSAARSGKPCRKLEDLLALMDGDELLELAFQLGIAGAEALGNSELIVAIGETVKTPEVLASLVETVHARDIDKLLDIIDHGGCLIVPEAKATFDTIMVPTEPLAFLFYSPGGFTYVVPDELVSLLGALDWTTIRAKAQQLLDICTLGGAAVELRGIVPMEEFLDDCHARYGELDDEDIVLQTLRGALAAPTYVILFVDDDIFLLDPDLAGTYISSAGDKASFVPDSPFLCGPLDAILASLLSDQADSAPQPRPIPQEMLDCAVPAFWRETLPAAIEMREWLVENAPDERDADRFASFMLRDFIDEVRWGDVGAETISRYSKMLEEAGLKLDSEGLVDFLGKLQTFLNGQPIWPTNGWAPIELA